MSKLFAVLDLHDISASGTVQTEISASGHRNVAPLICVADELCGPVDILWWYPPRKMWRDDL